jgi:dUTPase
MHIVGTFPVLVSPDTDYNMRVPVLVGTNVLDTFRKQMTKDNPSMTGLNQALKLACQSIDMRTRHLEKAAGVYGLVLAQEEVHVRPKECLMVNCRSQVAIPILKTVAMVTSSKPLLESGASFQVTPGLVFLSDSDVVTVELTNVTDQEIVLKPCTIIGELHQVTIEDSVADSDTVFLDQFNLGSLDLPDDNITALSKLLLEHKSGFACEKMDLGRTSIVKHRIDLSDEVPFKDRARRVPPALYDEVRKHLKEMLAANVIRESSSPWASNVVLVRKKDNTLRFCIDFRRLNNRTVRNAHPLPRIEETLDALKGAVWFSSLDLCCGYWQVEVEECDRPKTAFTVGPLGFYECNRMPFGLTNSPATFQALMEKVIADLNLKTCLVYLDDIVIFSTTIEEHLEQLSQILQRLREAGLKLKPSKCKFLHKELKYLGHIVSAGGVECDHGLTKDLLTWKTPTNVKEIQRFLGFAGFYRRFVQDFAKIAKPLHQLTGTVKGKHGKKHPVPWAWEEPQEIAFDTLIRLLTEPPILAYPDYSVPFKL